MEKLSLTIENELAIIEKYLITPQEWFVIRLLFLASEDSFPEFMRRFLTLPIEARGDVRTTLVNLQEKGIILKSYKIPKSGQPFYPEEVPFNKAFINTYFRCSFEMGEELWREYPDNIIINDRLYSLKNIAKKYNSPEDFFAAYGKIIKNKPEKHQQIIELLKWAKEHTNFINFNICEFIISQKWEEIERLRDGDYGGINLHNIQSL